MNRILPAPRSVQAGVVREDSTGARRRSARGHVRDHADSPRVGPVRGCVTTMRTPTGIVHFPPAGQDRMQGWPSVFSELRPLGNMSDLAPPDRKIPAIPPGWRTQHP
ncbi:hypothetical protein SBD_4941 [Streptomyces bottropensis ATCC 25435]|uniref:Uncharacterized protein n=1 Tax=Streptomyces bottropensis ATCC 25435 TaxID=1054862 RepID=M3EB32_9ACTN|nr:hypothetical protein SBD_4941 [Streptomyces bottropensis ATCC 25435]